MTEVTGTAFGMQTQRVVVDQIDHRVCLRNRIVNRNDYGGGRRGKKTMILRQGFMQVSRNAVFTRVCNRRYNKLERQYPEQQKKYGLTHHP